MGVHGLWDLLAPVGRRVSVETLAGKRLAIDASIWMIQFMKAMRDEKGEMVRNAHLLGFFRRICKLLYLRTKPIFVFDGGTPALKRRTVIARRRQRENAQAKIRKTAEKLLLNQLKQIRCKKLSEELKKQRSNYDAKGGKVIGDEASEKQQRNTDAKGKKIIIDDMAQDTSRGNGLNGDTHNQEQLDEMLATSLLAEDNEIFTVGESSSFLRTEAEEEDAEIDDNEEMILPVMHGRVDPAILAALPPSMQLDLLVQMRERLMAENRQKYQKVKKVPARFSELQIQAYLKTVAFRREIDEVQKSAAGRGIGGVKTSRIASESNREFIFSSSFSGDKEVLTSAGEGRRGDNQSLTPPANFSAKVVNDVTSKKHIAASGSKEEKPEIDFDNDVETYLDERGRLRVSRVRSMGIRMTRDIQRNLDLMKEIEEERVSNTKTATTESTIYRNGNDAMGSILSENFDLHTSGMGCANDNIEETLLTAETSLEISFEKNGGHEPCATDDDLFTSLVAGDPVMNFSVDNPLSNKEFLDSASEYEWEDGDALFNNTKVDMQPILTDGCVSDENELEWEEGSLDIAEAASLTPVGCRKITSKGAMEEEADFQEAIRRSLQDLDGQRSCDEPSIAVQSRGAAETASKGSDPGFHKDAATSEVSLEFNFQEGKSFCQGLERVEEIGIMDKGNILEATNVLDVHSPLPSIVKCCDVKVVTGKIQQNDPKLELLLHDASEMGDVDVELGTSVQGKDGYQIAKQQRSTAATVNEAIPRSSKNLESSTLTDVLSERVSDAISMGGQGNNFDAGLERNFSESMVREKLSTRDFRKDRDIEQGLTSEANNAYPSGEIEESLDKSSHVNHEKGHIEVTAASLEEEMLILGEEQRELGDEQRKLERNAESVSSEMFAECQELLQIFGLPYIVSPMEAEAQCAYMELAELVDGVVTDDSDAFLFGARSVYKNIFDDRKYVETYFMKDIENELGLNREKLIRVALLLGSDYTEGVSGIGIVNAIEVLNAFPEEDGLSKFREWIESPDPSILGNIEAQAENTSRRRESRVGDADTSCSDTKLGGASDVDAYVPQSVNETQKKKLIFMEKHRNVSKNWHIPSSFPSNAVISAYTSPQVDKSTEPFVWGKPDLFVLRKLCWDKFGWSIQKVDELLLPVLKEYNKRETQLRLEAFFTFNERFAKIRSKRIKKAVKGITGNTSLDLLDDSLQDGPKNKRKRRAESAVPVDKEAEKAETSEGQEFGDAGNADNCAEKVKCSRKKRVHKESLHAAETGCRLPIRTGNSQNKKGPSVRGRSKGGGRGTGRVIGNNQTTMGSIKANSSSEYAKSSPGDSSGDRRRESEGRSGDQCHVRRSGRCRREVNYAMDGLSNDDTDQDKGNSMDENSVRKDSSSNFLAVGDPVNECTCVELENPGEYLEKGESSCIDNAEVRREAIGSSSSYSEDFLSGNQLSREYVTMGGGFCLDEDDERMDSGQLADHQASELLFDSSVPNPSGSTEDENKGINADPSNANPTGTMDRVPGSENKGKMSVDVSDSNQGPVDATMNMSEEDSLRSLRAMPNLRRKKRKLNLEESLIL